VSGSRFGLINLILFLAGIDYFLAKKKMKKPQSISNFLPADNKLLTKKDKK